MFIALDKNNNRITIDNIDNISQYFCPICGEQLTIKAKNSELVNKHFAHIPGTICYDDFSHDMSEWHYNWQKQFPEQYREVVIEHNGEKHRADICINNTVIEFQHSPISSEEINKRNNFYLSCGYNMIWVFDADEQIKHWNNESIDPMNCEENELCWRIKKKQFDLANFNNICVFLQYKIPERKLDNLILLTELTSKKLRYRKTNPNYILPENFLKQYGGICSDNVLSISDILKLSRQPIRQKVIYYPNTYYRRPPGRGFRW